MFLKEQLGKPPAKVWTHSVSKRGNGTAYRKNHSDKVRFSEGSDDGDSFFINSTTEFTVVYTWSTKRQQKISTHKNMIFQGYVL